jgi:hypothetical protein
MKEKMAKLAAHIKVPKPPLTIAKHASKAQGFLALVKSESTKQAA